MRESAGTSDDRAATPVLWYGCLYGCLAVLMMAGCGEQSSGNPDAGGTDDVPFDCEVRGAPPDGGAIPADVYAVLESKCYACHGNPTERFAPMSLVTWADFQGCHSEKQRVPNFERMRIRINDMHTPMPPIREPQLTQEEREVLNTWAELGAPMAE